jgi:hypothetical protein
MRDGTPTSEQRVLENRSFRLVVKLNPLDQPPLKKAGVAEWDGGFPVCGWLLIGFHAKKKVSS